MKAPAQPCLARAFIDAMDRTVLVAAGVAVAGAVVALLFLPAANRPDDPVHTGAR